MALRKSELRDSTLSPRKIGHCRRHVMGTPASFAANGVPQSAADPAGHRAVVYEQRLGGPTWIFRTANTGISVTLEGRIHVTATEGIREAVFAGLGFAIVLGATGRPTAVVGMG